MKNFKFTLVALAILFQCGVTVSAAPESKLIEYWNVSNEQNRRILSHDTWQEILDAYLVPNAKDGVNLFDYAAVSKADKKKLADYIARLESLDPRSLEKREQFSYWVNLYNALTVKVVLDEYPVDSIKEIRSFSSLFGPWDKNYLKIADKKLSLNDIEHGILRPIWEDPRIHFVVNCASIGCPNLEAKAFTSDNSKVLMEKAASEFINNKRGVDVTLNRVVLSSIFDWYSGDFGEDESEVLEYIAEYYRGPNSKLLESIEKIEYQYDWQLNEVKK